MKTIGICFGRWNPPHKGHKLVWEIASQFDEWYVGTNENTQGKDDPLPYNIKIIAMETIWPCIKEHIMPEPNLFSLVVKSYLLHGKDTDLKVCTDESWLTTALLKYNGIEGKHGFYEFNSIEHVQTPRISSATSLRNAVMTNNRDEFTEFAGISADTPILSTKFFDLVSKHLENYYEQA